MKWSTTAPPLSVPPTSRLSGAPKRLRIDSEHELRSDWLEPGVPMRRDGAAATGSIANQVDDAPRSSDPLDAYFRNLDIKPPPLSSTANLLGG